MIESESKRAFSVIELLAFHSGKFYLLISETQVSPWPEKSSLMSSMWQIKSLECELSMRVFVYLNSSSLHQDHFITIVKLLGQKQKVLIHYKYSIIVIKGLFFYITRRDNVDANRLKLQARVPANEEKETV